jgi:hypothetical protein
MRDYFAFQEAMAKTKGPIDPDKRRNWRQTYAEVSEMTSAWCDRALKESRKGSVLR